MAFFLTNLQDQEDLLLQILKKVEFRDAVRLYHSCKWMKELMDERDIKHTFSGGTLCHETSFYEPYMLNNERHCRYTMDEMVQKTVRFGPERDSGNALLYYDSPVQAKFRRYRLEQTLTVKKYEFLRKVKDHDDAYYPKGTKLLEDDFRKTVLNDLRAMGGCEELMMMTELDDKDLLKLLNITKAKILIYGYYSFVKKVDLFREQAAKFKTVELRFFGQCIAEETSRNMFKTCGFLKLWILDFEYTDNVMLFLAEEWINGADVDQVQEIRFKRNNMALWKLGRLYAILTQTAETTFRGTVYNGPIEYTTTRIETPCRKDFLKVSIRPDVIVFRFIKTEPYL